MFLLGLYGFIPANHKRRKSSENTSWIGACSMGSPARYQTFEGEMWREVLKWGQDEVEVLHPPTFYPLSQGIAEKHMSVIMAALSNAPVYWPTKIKFLAFTRNMSPLQSSQLAPFELVLGKKPESLSDFLTWTHNPDPDATLDEVHAKLVQELELAWEYERACIYGTAEATWSRPL
jgi:hypothetical protein